MFLKRITLFLQMLSIKYTRTAVLLYYFLSFLFFSFLLFFLFFLYFFPSPFFRFFSFHFFSLIFLFFSLFFLFFSGHQVNSMDPSQSLPRWPVVAAWIHTKPSDVATLGSDLRNQTPLTNLAITTSGDPKQLDIQTRLRSGRQVATDN